MVYNVVFKKCFYNILGLRKTMYYYDNYKL
jgi:hypothetical protein